MTAAVGTSAAVPRWARLYYFLLLFGAFCLPLTFLNLPAIGGGSRPLIAIIWFVLFVGLFARMLLEHRGNAIEVALGCIILLGFLWYPHVITTEGDVSEYFVRMASVVSGMSVAIVASNLQHPRLTLPHLSTRRPRRSTHLAG